MNRRDLFKLTGAGVAAFLVSAYGRPDREPTARVDWGPFNPRPGEIWLVNTYRRPVTARVWIGPTSMLRELKDRSEAKEGPT